jgi:HK97 family phage major capsid protein
MVTGLKEQMRAELEAADAIAAKCQQEQREPTNEELGQMQTHLRAFQTAKEQFEQSKSNEHVQSVLDQIGAGLKEVGRTDPEEKQDPESYVDPRAGRRLKTIGEIFTESAQYKSMMAGLPEGFYAGKSHVSSQPVGVKALITGLADTSAGAFITTDRQGDFELLGRRELTLRDMVSKRRTGSDTVEFVQQTTQMNSAAPVAEATTAAMPTAPGTAGALVLPAGGGYKPEGSVAYAVVTTTVKTIAEWIPATKRSLADVAQLRGLIDQELREDLAEEEEDQILNGSGSGENLLGILNTSGIQTQAYSSTVAGVDPKTETLFRARTKVMTVGRARPTAYLLNPLDWESIALARLAKNPANEGEGLATERLHGLPVNLSEAIAAGRALVGDFRKAVIWDREQASISATDSHADFFIRNLVAILGEERLAFGVLRPKAFVDVDLTP